MTKIVQLSISNIKRLYAVDITPTDPVTLICGENGEGKSSVLDSVLMALGGKDYVPEVPIHVGEDSGEIVVRLDSGLVVKRTFTAAGNSYLKITGPDGSPTGQAGLDELTSKLGFDPLAFTRLDAAKQKETLQRMVGLDFTKLNADRKKAYDERTIVNRRLDEMRGAVAALPEYPDAPAEEVSSAEVLAQIEVAQEHNAELTTLVAAKTAAQVTVDRATESVKRTTALITALKKQLADAEVQLAKDVKVREAADKVAVAAADAVEGFQPIDTANLKAQLESCEEANRQVRANAQRAAAVAQGIAKKAESDALTAKIEAIDEQKSKALAGVTFPVEGLSFTDDGVTYKGLPFSQASSAEKQRVSVAIGAALNPRLPVMLIRDGSLLDSKSLAALKQSAEELSLQIFVERVGVGDEGGIIIEDGRIAGISAEQSAVTTSTPASRPAAPKPATKAFATKVATPAPAVAAAPAPVAAKPAKRKPAPF